MNAGLFAFPEGATLLTPEEIRELIPSDIVYRGELNEVEQENILRGQEWALARQRDPLAVKFVTELHRQMFGDVWRWAGRFRTSARDIGVEHWEIRPELTRLLEDARAWIEFASYAPDEVAVRFHHRLVCIHPFPNRNGRHARLIADLLAMRLGRPRLSWGRTGIRDAGAARAAYIEALRAADRHDMAPLLAFVRG